MWWWWVPTFCEQNYTRDFSLLTSLEMRASQLGQAIRLHWSIENGLHWTLDVTFKEDACRVHYRTYYTKKSSGIYDELHSNQNSLFRSTRQKSNQPAMDNNYMLAVLAACLSKHDDTSKLLVNSIWDALTCMIYRCTVSTIGRQFESSVFCQARSKASSYDQQSCQSRKRWWKLFLLTSIAVTASSNANFIVLNMKKDERLNNSL